MAEDPAASSTLVSGGRAVQSVAYDPSKNVLDLVEAAVKRLDDLSMANARWTEALRVIEVKRIDDKVFMAESHSEAMRNAEAKRVAEEVKLYASFHDKLFEAERDRINAIRAVDVGAVAVAAERSQQQATVLANQVAASAETLRSLVAATASANAAATTAAATQFADRLASTEKALTDRIGALEKAQYENKGKSGVADPAFEQLVRQVNDIVGRQQMSVGKSEGVSSTTTAIIGGVGLIATLIVVGTFVFAGRTQRMAEPQVIVAPPAVISAAPAK